MQRYVPESYQLGYEGIFDIFVRDLGFMNPYLLSLGQPLHAFTIMDIAKYMGLCELCHPQTQHAPCGRPKVRVSAIHCGSRWARKRGKYLSLRLNTILDIRPTLFHSFFQQPSHRPTFFSNHSSHCSFTQLDEIAVSSSPLNTTVGLTWIPIFLPTLICVFRSAVT
jgi:hypothetical protein